MTRVGSAAASDLIISRILNTQNNIFNFQRQTASEKVSTLYSGLDGGAQRLVNLENSRNSLLRFQDNNIQAELRNNVATTVLESAEDLMKNFRTTLFDLREQPLTRSEVTALQEEAFRNLVELEALLNTDVDGRHIFGGGRVLEKPLDLGLSTFEELQSRFDGELVSVPTTRTGNLDEFVIDENPNTGDPNHLSFTRDSGSGVSRITSSTAQFANVEAGTTITISGTVSGANDGTYEVKSVDSSGFYVEVVTKQFAANNTPQTVTLTYPDRNDPSITQTLSGVNVTFDRDTNQMTVTNGANISNIQVGEWFTISGSSDNDGTYTVNANDNTNITIDAKRLTNEGGTSATLVNGVTGANFDFSTTVINLTDSNPDTLAAVAEGTFSNVQAGDRLQFSGTNDQNEGRIVEVASVSADGTTITLTSGTGITVPPSFPTTGTFLTRPEQFQFDASRTLKTLDPTFNAMSIDAATNNITLTNATGTIDLAGGAAFVDGTGNALPVGTRLTLTGATNGLNNQTYTVTAVAGTQVTVTPVPPADETITVGAGNLVSSGSITFTQSAGAGGQDQITLGGGLTFTDHDGNALAVGTEIVMNGGANNGVSYFIESLVDSTTANLTVSATVVNETDNLTNSLTASAAVTFTDNGTSGADTITLGGATFTDADGNALKAGSQITFAGTSDANNDQTFTIASLSTDNRTATLVASDEVTTTTTPSTTGTVTIGEVSGTVSSTSYYQGDNTSITHRISDTLTIEDDLNAVHPSFEKAIRAMMLIAQGEVGTAGGLDQNLTRIDNAAFLMNDALDAANIMPEPFGTEQTGSMDRLIVEVGFDQVLLNDVTVRNEEVLAFLEESIANIENVDPLEAITNLLDEQTALEASFETFTRVRQLSLLQFLG